jgi:hypothetical protein
VLAVANGALKVGGAVKGSGVVHMLAPLAGHDVAAGPMASPGLAAPKVQIA